MNMGWRTQRGKRVQNGGGGVGEGKQGPSTSTPAPVVIQLCSSREEKCLLSCCQPFVKSEVGVAIYLASTPQLPRYGMKMHPGKGGILIDKEEGPLGVGKWGWFVSAPLWP